MINDNGSGLAHTARTRSTMAKFPRWLRAQKQKYYSQAMNWKYREREQVAYQLRCPFVTPYYWTEIAEKPETTQQASQIPATGTL